MGMGTWGRPPSTSSSSSSRRCSVRQWHSLSVLLTSLATLLALALLPTASALGLGCSGEPCCPIQRCMDLFQAAQDNLLGIQDSFMTPDLGALSAQEHANHCIARRTLLVCLRNITRQCKGDLQYHAASKGTEKQVKQMNCTDRGPVFDPSTDIVRVPARPLCHYRGSTRHRHCGMFGQPHLTTFSGEQVTCGVQGAWPLVDNKYLTVQATNGAVGSLSPKITATTSLTVMLKKEEKCGSHHFVTYQAQWDNLPSEFDDGRTRFGREHSVELTVVEANAHVEIYLRYIDTTVVVRRIENYLSFAIKMPEDIVEENLVADPHGMELCAKSCPQTELINQEKFLAQKHSRLKTSGSSSSTRAWTEESSSSTPAVAMSRDDAVQLCKNSQVVGFYFDSCVFDLMSTGDSNFSLAALRAQQDAVRLHPQTRAVLENRTSLEKYEKLYGSGAGSLHRTSLGAECFLRTACLLVLCQLILHVNTGSMCSR